MDVELDTKPREVSVPPYFAQALYRDAVARRFFDGLSYSNRRRFVIGVIEVVEQGRRFMVGEPVSLAMDGLIFPPIVSTRPC